MLRTRKRIVLGILAILLLSGVAIGGFYWYRRGHARPDIHQLGGTLLVFEVDEDDKHASGCSNYSWCFMEQASRKGETSINPQERKSTMATTFTAENATEALILEQALAYARQLQRTAAEAADGQVLHSAEKSKENQRGRRKIKGVGTRSFENQRGRDS